MSLENRKKNFKTPTKRKKILKKTLNTYFKKIMYYCNKNRTKLFFFDAQLKLYNCLVIGNSPNSVRKGKSQIHPKHIPEHSDHQIPQIIEKEQDNPARSQASRERTDHQSTRIVCKRSSERRTATNHLTFRLSASASLRQNMSRRCVVLPGPGHSRQGVACSRVMT